MDRRRCFDGQPIPFRDKRPFSSDQLIRSDDVVYVGKILFDIDKDRYDLFMLKLIVMISTNRNRGYVRIDLEASKSKSVGLDFKASKSRSIDELIGIFIRKKSLYIVAIFDGKHLFEIGTSDYQFGYFSDAFFTEFRERYEDLFGKDRKSLIGIEIGWNELRRCFRVIVDTVSCCSEWRYSIGIFALLFCEPARFVWMLEVLIQELRWEDGFVILSGRYKWMALLPKNWGDITRVALQKYPWYPTTRPQNDTHSNTGFERLLEVQMWAWRALIFLYVDCRGSEDGYGGGRGDAGPLGARGGGFDRVVTRYGKQDQAEPRKEDCGENDGGGTGSVRGAQGSSFDHVAAASYSSYHHQKPKAVRRREYQYVKRTKKRKYGTTP